jgi:hypothetical protein
MIFSIDLVLIDGATVSPNAFLLPMHRLSMYRGFMRDELEQFVASLAIPADRKAIVLAELADHLACAREAAVRDGLDPDAAGRAALGNLEALRRSLEAVEPAFRITRWHAIARGLVASLLVAILLDQGGSVMRGVVGALLVLAIGVVCAPPRALELLRAELRAPRVRGAVTRGIPIGPAITYGFTVMSAPFLVWIGLIVVRGFGGVVTVHVPFSAFSLAAGLYLLLLVESIRARREVAA